MPLAFAFAAIAGDADAIGYLRYKAFAGMMTGNTVLMGLAFFQRADRPAEEYAVVLAIFFVTSAIAFVLLRKRCSPLVLLVAEAVALLLRFAEGLVGRVVPHCGHKAAPFAIYGIAWLGYAIGAALARPVFRLCAGR